MTAPVRVWTVDAAAMDVARPRLSEILIDRVQHGASVGSLSPLEPADADVVQLDIDTLPYQPHRATVHKLLVHSAARRRGVGEALMREVERVALDAGRWLLTLNSATADAGHLYQRLGWTVAGVIPRCALNPDRTLTDTTLYWKQLTSNRSRASIDI